VLAALDRKLFRDLWHVRGQALAIAAVIMSGVALFVTELSTQASLALTRSDYYAQYRFAEVFARCKRAPNTITERIAAIDGVDTVQTRVVSEVTLDVPGLIEPAVGRLVSVPRTRRPALNDVFLRSGRYIEPTDRDAVLASEGFVLAHKLKPGDKVAAVINGRRRELTIVGVALSPEFIYSIRDGDFLPDDKRFGIFWMSEDEVANAFDMQGAFNDVTLTLEENANALYVLSELDKVLEPYGGIGAIERKHQVSHWYLENELTQLKNIGIAMPLVFLGVAAFLLNVVLTRLISHAARADRRAQGLGLSERSAWAAHYTKLVLADRRPWRGASGAAVGDRPGQTAHRPVRRVLSASRSLRFSHPAPLSCSGIGHHGAGHRGAGHAVGHRCATAIVLPPAEAMRPPSPGRVPAYDGSSASARSASCRQTTRMLLRRLQRRRLRSRSACPCCGIAGGRGGRSSLGNFFIDAIEVRGRCAVQCAPWSGSDVARWRGRSRRTYRMRCMEIESLPGVLHVGDLSRRARHVFAATAARRQRSHHGRG
jgi:putative ABC transport system permease protein